MVKNEIEEVSKVSKEKKTMVLTTLPTQPITEGKIGEEEYDFLSVESALTEILQNTREIKKAVA